MRHVKNLKTISLILGFSLVVFGCATSKNINKTESGMTVTTEGTSEGLRLDFHNIPDDAYSIFVSFLDINENEQNEEFATTQIYIWENTLTNLKHSGYLICPFVKNGRYYSIMVFVYTMADFENNFDNPVPIIYSTSGIAGGGIFLTNNPSLNFTDMNRTVTLSEMPIFSEEVIYSARGMFQFTNYVLIDGSSYGGGMSHWNEFVYPVREMLSETQEHFGFTGDFPVNAMAHILLMNNEYEWSVFVAKAHEVAIMSF